VIELRAALETEVGELALFAVAATVNGNPIAEGRLALRRGEAAS
jgi:hypothetical protein